MPPTPSREKGVLKPRFSVAHGVWTEAVGRQPLPQVLEPDLVGMEQNPFLRDDLADPSHEPPHALPNVRGGRRGTVTSGANKAPTALGLLHRSLRGLELAGGAGGQGLPGRVLVPTLRR